MSVRQRVRAIGGVGMALALCLPLLMGCGGNGGPEGGTGNKDEKKGGGTKPETPAAKKSWADRVFEVYQSGFTETVALLEKQPPAAEALPKLQAIRDKAIEALVPLGREREAMDAAAKAQADSQFSLKASMDFPNTETFKAYAKLHDGPYNITKMQKTDEEKAFQKILAGMNIISQYAFFEVLKRQEPKEAERLGVK